MIVMAIEKTTNDSMTTVTTGEATDDDIMSGRSFRGICRQRRKLRSSPLMVKAVTHESGDSTTKVQTKVKPSDPSNDDNDKGTLDFAISVMETAVENINDEKPKLHRVDDLRSRESAGVPSADN